MGCEHGAWGSPDLRAGGKRLLGENVQGRARDRPLFERGGERVEVHDLATRGVDHDCAGLHPTERLGADQPARLLGERRVERDDVGGPEQLVEVDEAGAGGARGRLGRERVVRDDGHAEGAGPAGHLAADPSDPDEAECLGAKLSAGELRARPLAGADAAVGIDDPAEERERERERVFCRGHDVAEGRVHDVHPPRCRGGYIDVVDADAGANDGS